MAKKNLFPHVFNGVKIVTALAIISSTSLAVSKHVGDGHRREGSPCIPATNSGNRPITENWRHLWLPKRVRQRRSDDPRALHLDRGARTLAAGGEGADVNDLYIPTLHQVQTRPLPAHRGRLARPLLVRPNSHQGRRRLVTTSRVRCNFYGKRRGQIIGLGCIGVLGVNASATASVISRR